VPRLPGDDGVERPARGVPGLERRHVDLQAVAAREVGHARVGFDARYPAARRPELPGGDAGARADVEDVGAGGGGDHGLDHGVGVAGAGAVVALGVRAERFR
jgi:hypothetical protein